MPQQKRVFWVMIDSLGVGELPDASQFGDKGANTLGHIIDSVENFSCPQLRKLGLANVLNHPRWQACADPLGSFGKMAELSPGKDTTTGHWEMAGVPLSFAFPLFPNGFPDSLIQEFIVRAKVPGILANRPASGTEIIQELGVEHMHSGKPIVYTSGDSVFQIAAHEESFGLNRLYEICKIARDLCDALKVGRIIARPFLGDKPENFKRTPNRHDYSVPPPKPTVLDLAKSKGLDVLGIGKIPDIFAHLGITREIPSESNRNGMEILTKLAKESSWNGIAMINLVDFDSLFGHRRNVRGYHQALEEFDHDLKFLLEALRGEDLLLLSADHGCDPTHRGTDHTREYVPIVMYQPNTKSKNLGTRKTFADVAATVAPFLNLGPWPIGSNLL